MKSKLKILICLIFAQTAIFGQTTIKANLLTALVAVPNIGFETKIGKQTTFQLDVTASFWKSFRGSQEQFVIVTPEFRYYFREIFSGFYFGGHLGGTAFEMQKFNYSNTNRYQEGFGYMIGGTIGYQYKINDRFNAEFFIGGGSIQSFYKGYERSTGIRYDEATRYNKSGEFLPYRGGFMLVYKLK
jgi:hypothetical protein